MPLTAGLTFIEGKDALELVKRFGFLRKALLPVLSTVNIWHNNYAQTLHIIDELKKFVSDIVLSTSCSLLHVPV